jgi:hypothetical protein
VSDTVLVGLLSLLGTLGGAFGGIIVANRLVNYRLTELEKKVDAHGALVDRMYCAERRLDVLGEQLRSVNTAVGEIELKMNGE